MQNVVRSGNKKLTVVSFMPSRLKISIIIWGIMPSIGQRYLATTPGGRTPVVAEGDVPDVLPRHLAGQHDGEVPLVDLRAARCVAASFGAAARRPEGRPDSNTSGLGRAAASFKKNASFEIFLM